MELRSRFTLTLNGPTANTKNTKDTTNTKPEDHAAGWWDRACAVE